jgi:hypothetical protein
VRWCQLVLAQKTLELHVEQLEHANVYSLSDYSWRINSELAHPVKVAAASIIRDTRDTRVVC